MEDQPKPRMFPSEREYEKDIVMKGNRALLLDVISKIRDVMNEVHGDNEVIKQQKIKELVDCCPRLESVAVDSAYLKKFSEENGRFTEEARKNPDVMIKWVAHDLLGIIKKLPRAMTVSDVEAQMGEFTDIERSDGSAVGIMRGEDLTPGMADFLASQTAINIYVRVLDAEHY